MKDLIVGTAGHIDHGKTALVRALTGIDTDRLAEEKRRGITIDIGFAHTEVGGYRVGFVDVPGHERFVKNMLSGIGGIQLVLLVVAADESIMPQTIEHFQICKLLEIPSGIIVITKKDQVDSDLLELVRIEVSELVRGSFLERAPICYVDSPSGKGIAELREALQNEITSLDQRDRLAPPLDRLFRLPVDRVFTVKGFGTVVTGTPQGGTIRHEETIEVYPGGQKGKIRGIQIFGKESEEAKAGQRTALNLSGINKEILERGVVLASAGQLKLSKRFDVTLQLLEDAPSPIRNRDPIRFHHGSGELLGRIYLLERRALEPGEKSLAQIRLDESTVCFPGDHFILRRYSPLSTIGGGIVLDGVPPKWRQKDREDRCTQLRQIISALADSEAVGFAKLIEHYVDRSGVLGIDLDTLSSLTGLDTSKAHEVIEGLELVQTIPLDPPLFACRANLESLKEKICSYLQQYHRSKPLSFGSPREELKERFLPGGTGPYFQFLLNTWQQEHSIKIRGSDVAFHDSEIRLTAEQEEFKSNIFRIIEGSRLNTPTLDEIVVKLGHKEGDVRDLLFYLIDSGEILKISGNMVLLPSQLRWVEDRVRANFPTGTSFTVSDFKDLLSISRKYAIPLLELLDRNKVTRRTGDSRVVI